MTHYTATIEHHSISRARVVKFEAKTLAAAKRAAMREFCDEQQNYIIDLRADADFHPNPQGYSTRRVGATGRNAWLDI